MGKSLIIIGVILVVAGIFLTFGGGLPRIGRLPGDIIIQKKNFTFYFPIVTCILISIVLSFIFFLFFRQR